MQDTLDTKELDAYSGWASLVYPVDQPVTEHRRQEVTTGRDATDGRPPCPSSHGSTVARSRLMFYPEYLTPHHGPSLCGRTALACLHDLDRTLFASLCYQPAVEEIQDNGKVKQQHDYRADRGVLHHLIKLPRQIEAT